MFMIFFNLTDGSDNEHQTQVDVYRKTGAFHFIYSPRHDGNFNYFNPWILENINKLKVIGHPKSIELHASKEFEEYIEMMKALLSKNLTLYLPIK